MHNKGKIRSTKRKIPWVIVCTEVYQTLLEARRREKQIKSWKSRKAVERLL